jgi:cyclase
VARQLDLGRFAEWQDAEPIVGNLHRAYPELRGEANGARMTLAPAIEDMITFTGGRRLRCSA